MFLLCPNQPDSRVPRHDVAPHSCSSSTERVVPSSSAFRRENTTFDDPLSWHTHCATATPGGTDEQNAASKNPAVGMMRKCHSPALLFRAAKPVCSLLDWLFG